MESEQDDTLWAQLIQRKLRKMPKTEWGQWFTENDLSKKRFERITGIKISSVNLTPIVSGI